MKVGQMPVSLGVADPGNHYFNKTDSIGLECFPQKLLQFGLTQFGETKPQVVSQTCRLLRAK